MKNGENNSLRPAAWITGTLCVLFCLFGLIGYLIEGIQKNDGKFKMPGDWLGVATEVFIFIGLGGLIVAYWREGTGGLISLIAFILATIFLIADPQLNFSPIFFLLYLPTFLYLAYWRESRK